MLCTNNTINRYNNSTTIIQWNCRGFLGKKCEIQLLINNLKPLIIAFQETKLLPTINVQGFNSFNLYRKDYADGLIACRGVMLMVHKSVYSEHIPVVSPLSVVAVKVKSPHLNYELSVCSIYIPPNEGITETQLLNIVSQIGKPYLLCGDFNAHNPMWGRNRPNASGREIENFLLNHSDAYLLNTNNEITHVNFSYRTTSTIDLTIATRTIACDVTWAVHDDLHFSDHLPIIINLQNLDGVQRSGRAIWNFKKADWSKYREKIDFQYKIADISDIDETIQLINSNMLEAAKSSIPLVNTGKLKKYTPWWCNEIKEAINSRKQALKIFRRNSTPSNFIEFKRRRAKARRLILNAKKEAWSSFVASIDSPLSQKDMWAQIRRIKGKKPYNPVTALINTDGIITTDKKLMSEILVQSYIKNSANSVYNENFRKFKQTYEERLHCPSNTENEIYNLSFTMSELLATFKTCKSSAGGIDNICYPMIIYLPMDALEKLLEIFNYVWTNGNFPAVWKTAIIIPILKPNKNTLDPVSYRPISLLSCTNKILEKMISKRLKWLIEKKNLVDPYQSGNRKMRSTMDNLLMLEHEVITAFNQKEDVVAIFLDVNKFFDRISKITILNKFMEKNIGGPMYNYVNNFLSQPQIAVKIEDQLSSTQMLDNGIRQGSSLSGDLCNVATCDISSVIPRDVMHGMFVDDLVIYVRGSDMDILERKLQETLNKLSSWSDTNGLSFSPEKTIGLIFSRKNLIQKPRLLFQNVTIKFDRKAKWLGLYLDPKLSWASQITEVKSKSLRALNILKILCNKNWGLRRHTLLKLYQAFVLPILDYGCCLYGSAKENHLKKINVVHHTALRMITGAFRTSPIVSILAESGQPSLDTRRNLLMTNYVCKVATNPNHPCYTIFFNKLLKINITNINLPKSLTIRFQKLNETGTTPLNPSLIYKETTEEAPWCIKPPNVEMITTGCKSSMIPQSVIQRHLEFRNEHGKDNIICYTDGSRTENNTGGAYLFNGTIYQFKLNPISSVYTAELVAILKCLEAIYRFIHESFNNKHFIICSDSKSSLLAIKNIFSSSIIIRKILLMISDINSRGYRIRFLWIPSHIGIKENEMVDKAAKTSHNSVIEPLCTYEDFRNKIKRDIKQSWLNNWKNQPLSNKLRRIKDDVFPWNSSHWQNRKNEIVICRLRIGHTLATHKYLLDRRDPPVCEECGAVPLTVKHILIDCPGLGHLRRKYKLSSSIKEILEDNPESLERCIAYLSNAKLLNKI